MSKIIDQDDGVDTKNQSKKWVLNSKSEDVVQRDKQKTSPKLHKWILNGYFCLTILTFPFKKEKAKYRYQLKDRKCLTTRGAKRPPTEP